MCLTATSACTSTDQSGVVDTTDAVDGSVPIATDDTVLIAVEGASECATALAAFSAVSNILMSGLAKPSSFEAERYEQNLELTSGVITAEIAAVYEVFKTGYGTAGEALATARDVGVGTAQGEDAVDEATAILNDVTVTDAAQEVATFLANDCVINR